MRPRSTELDNSDDQRDAIPQRAASAALRPASPNALQIKPSIASWTGIGMVTGFWLQKAFLDERIDSCFV